MATDNQVLDVVGTIYDCVIEPNRWPEALERLSGLLDCSGAVVTLQDPRQRRVRLVTGWGFTPQFSQAMDEAASFNPLMSSGWYMNEDEPFTGVEMLGRDAYYASRFYREVLRPHGYCDAAISIFAKTSNRFGAISLSHTTEQGEWNVTQLHDVRKIVPHVRRAVTISDLLDARTLHQDMLSTTLDLLTVGIILVDSHARVIHANHAGLQHLDDRTALRRDGDYLSARLPVASQDLREAIAAAANGTTVTLPKSGSVVSVPGAHGSDLAVWALPLDSGLRSNLAAPFAANVALFIRELGDTSPFPGELFVKRYKISSAECRVLMMLVQGLSLAETCDALGISEPTGKTHLTHLFAKTGTKRQSELMRLAMSALAPASNEIRRGRNSHC